MRQISPSLLVTSWRPSMNTDRSPFAIWLQSQMDKFDLTTKDLVKWGDVSYQKLYYHLHKSKSKPQIDSIKAICLALASVAPKDYWMIYYEALQATNQENLFPLNKIKYLTGE